MRTLLLTIAGVLLATGFAPQAEAASKRGIHSDSIWVGHYRPNYSWRALNRQELIVWSTSRKPYLVRLWRPVHSLRFANHIGLSRSGGRITKFDSVYVDGWRVPIASIQRLHRDDAKKRQRNFRKKRR